MAQQTHIIILVNFVTGNKRDTGHLTVIILLFWRTNRAPSVTHNERLLDAEFYCLLQDRWSKAVLNLQSTQVLKSTV